MNTQNLSTVTGLIALLVCNGAQLGCTDGNLGSDDELSADAGLTAPACTDNDGDGYGDGCDSGNDCDDNDSAIHPGGSETCNGADDNCDGQVDEGVLNSCGTCDPTCQAGQVEICTPPGGVAADENQDGSVDEGCSCEPFQTQACCGLGIQVCQEATDSEFGGGWGVCEGGTLTEEICGDGIDQDCDGADTPCPNVEVSCQQGPRQTAEFTLHFPGNGPNCPWGQGDNNGPLNGFHAARIEHTQSMDLPPNSAICNLDFTVPQANMYFDDVLVLTFNEAVMMAGFKVDELLDNVGGLFLYQWANMSAKAFNYELYCLGGGPCELPDTQANGSIALDLSDSVTMALAQRALNLHRFDFEVIVTGDDNANSDCAYSAFDLVVDVEYVDLAGN